MTLFKPKRCLSRKLLLAVGGITAVATPTLLGTLQLPLSAQSIPVQASPVPPPDLPDWQAAAAGGEMAFEVASVRQSTPEAFRPPIFPLDVSNSYGKSDPGGRFFAVFPLSSYIGFAYKQFLTPRARESLTVHLPKWVSTDFFEINARAEGNATKDQMRLMMQSLLADRFKLKIHFETQLVPVYALTLEKPGKTGPKLRPHADGPSCETLTPSVSSGSSATDAAVFPADCDSFVLLDGPKGTMLLGSRNASMGLIASFLADMDMDRPVVDETRLNGRFDVAMQWTPEPDASAGASPSLESLGTSFLEALKEQLGLKLIPTKAPVKVLVIDHVEKPSEN